MIQELEGGSETQELLARIHWWESFTNRARLHRGVLNNQKREKIN